MGSVFSSYITLPSSRPSYYSVLSLSFCCLLECRLELPVGFDLYGSCAFIHSFGEFLSAVAMTWHFTGPLPTLQHLQSFCLSPSVMFPWVVPVVCACPGLCVCVCVLVQLSHLWLSAQQSFLLLWLVMNFCINCCPLQEEASEVSGWKHYLEGSLITCQILRWWHLHPSQGWWSILSSFFTLRECLPCDELVVFFGGSI